MRIGLIAPPWLSVPPTGYGGTENVVDLLARGFLAGGHDVLLCSTGDSTCPVDRVSTLPAAAGTHNMNPATEVHHILRSYAAIERWGADIVHDHTVVGPLYASSVDIPVVTTNHGPFDSELGELYRAVSGRVAVVAISRHHAASSIGTRIAGVIHHGIDVSSIPFGSGEGGFAAFLGRMCPDKGVDRAARLARAAGVPLKIAAKLAEPAERDYFDAAVRPLLGGEIEYVGEVSGAQKYDLLGQASCLLNPLQWDEPFGMVMIEALACGTPVVATPRGSVPEIVDHGRTGFVSAADDALSASLLHRIVDLDRRACRHVASRRFSAQRMVADYVELFSTLVAEHELLPAAALAG
jgi:glycosyltransferase involved in cell wall biosynthesis